MDVALIGIDGLEPTLVRQWQDDLPTLSSLISAGRFGRLRSSDPPLTSPAWPTLYTGKQGGKHGVFGFTRRATDSYDRVPVNHDDVKAETLWEVLDDSGIACGVANVPLTFPPTELEHGYVLSGWPVPNRERVCSDPDILADLERSLGTDYEVNPFPLTLEFDELDDESLASEISEGLWHHHAAFEHLVESHPVDFFFCVFMAIDIASHNFAWERDHLKELYIQQDEALGRLLETIPDDTDTVVMSDHGHAVKGTRSFHVNEWLRQEGYLTLADEESRGVLERLGVTQRNYVRIKNTLPVGNVHELLPQPVYQKLTTLVPRDTESAEFNPDRIDWTETRAYSGSQNQIHLNTTDHPAGVVNEADAPNLRTEITDRLQEIPHPDSTGPLMTAVETSPDLFDGPFLDAAPDIVFIADDMACNAPVGFNDGALFSDERWGEHRQHGVLLTAGPSFATEAVDETDDIKDVFPLILSLFDVGIPDNTDGTIPAERLEQPPEPTFRPSRDQHQHAGGYTQSEADDIKAQLEGLGYLE
jgi:predicted AlkP superfamily phosphohydrolase/phosphomutase